jgi:hypothetical protein
VLRQEANCSFLLTDNIREYLFDVLGCDERLVRIMLEEADHTSSELCPNLLTALAIAHIQEDSEYPLLEQVLQHPQLDFETLMGKLSIALDHSELSFPDCLNIICRQFDPAQDSLLAERMKRFILTQQTDETGYLCPLNINDLPLGAYKEWLEYLYNTRPPKINPLFN